MRRMIGGAETALLTLTDGTTPQPGSESSLNFTNPYNNNTPAKFVAFKPSLSAVKTLVEKYQQNARPNKKDLKLTASQLFDIYSKATPQARGKFDMSVPLNGFVEELGEAVKLTPQNAKIFFNSLINLIEEMQPPSSSSNPILEAQEEGIRRQEEMVRGKGKNSGCGCGCNGGNAPDSQKKPLEPDSQKKPLAPDSQKKPLVNAMSPPNKEELRTNKPSGNPVANALAWLKSRREAMGQNPPSMTPKAPENPEPASPPPSTGSGKNVSKIIAEGIRLARLKGGRDKKFLPGMTHKKILPGMTHKKILPGMTHKKILPGMIHMIEEESESNSSSESESDSSSESESDSSSESESDSNNKPQYNGKGKGKKGVNKRSMIVKKIMKERGVSLPEASKIVKSEGLY